MRIGIGFGLAAVALVMAAPLAAQAQNGISTPNATIGPIVRPNTAGSVVYQTSGGTTVATDGSTVFHGTSKPAGMKLRLILGIRIRPGGRIPRILIRDFRETVCDTSYFRTLRQNSIPI